MELTTAELKAIIDRTAKAAVKESQKKKYHMSEYKKTEYILRNYADLKKAAGDSTLTRKVLDRLDVILLDLKSEPYFKAIELYYFEKNKLDVVAVELGVSTATVHSAKNKIVEKISIRLFADNIIKEIIKGE